MRTRHGTKTTEAGRSSWQTQPGGEQVELVAIDIEGSGAQDRDHEAILEIALVPIVDWHPDMGSSYCTLINPERRIPRRPWISPGITDAVLRDAPTLARVEPELARRINDKYLVGHNVGVDWRLLHRRCPNITPSGLIDTLRLARCLGSAGSKTLGTIVERLGLTKEINRLAARSVPHRALWDAVAAALLSTTLARQTYGRAGDIDTLIAAAGIPTAGTSSADTSQPRLFD
ncbi:3'-5' exonuclease [Micromonospora sp. CPCC 205371]|nr:3'-5' exonuclease [Micromonospora sp. CPCC 205371]